MPHRLFLVRMDLAHESTNPVPKISGINIKTKPCPSPRINEERQKPHQNPVLHALKLCLGGNGPSHHPPIGPRNALRLSSEHGCRDGHRTLVAGNSRQDGRAQSAITTAAIWNNTSVLLFDFLVPFLGLTTIALNSSLRAG